MDYKIYELMMLFAFYSVICWILEQLLYCITGKIVNRGFLRGPINLTYGVSGVIISALMSEYDHNYVYIICGSLLICVLVQFVAAGLIWLISGAFFSNYYFIFPILGGIFSLQLTETVNPAIINYLHAVPLWIHFIFLLLFYSYIIIDMIDSIDLLRSYRKEIKILRNMNVDAQEYGEKICIFLRKYHRWIKAYPEFKNRTMKRLLKGYKREEMIVIEDSIKNNLD